MKERRYERSSAVLEAILESSSGKHEVRVSDISPGGCFIDSIVSVTIGETVHFITEFPGMAAKELTGRVVYVLHGIGFGLSFDDISEDERNELAELIAKLK